MKTISIVLATLMTTHIAFGQDSKPDTLQDRTELTRSSIRTSIEDLRNVTASSTMEDFKDLEVILEKFSKNVEEVLKNYQNEFEDEVIKPVRLLIKDYNTVKASDHYQQDEKKVLLDDIYNRAKDLARRSSSAFQLKYMNKLFSLISDSPEIIILLEVKNQRLKEVLMHGDKLLNLYNYKNLVTEYAPATLFLYKEFDDYRNPTQFTLYKGCYSRGCQTLLSLAIDKYLHLMKNLNADFSFELDNKRTLTFPGASIGERLTSVKGAFKQAYSIFSTQTFNFSLSSQELDLINEMIKTASETEDPQECKVEMKKLREEHCKLGTSNCTSDLFRKNLAINITERKLLDPFQKQIDNLKHENIKYQQNIDELTLEAGRTSRERKRSKIWAKVAENKRLLKVNTDEISKLTIGSLAERQKCVLE